MQRWPGDLDCGCSVETLASGTLTHASKACHQKWKRPTAPPFETLLAYNTWVNLYGQKAPRSGSGHVTQHCLSWTTVPQGRACSVQSHWGELGSFPLVMPLGPASATDSPSQSPSSLDHPPQARAAPGRRRQSAYSPKVPPCHACVFAINWYKSLCSS
jgi:hypothetical protein